MSIIEVGFYISSLVSFSVHRCEDFNTIYKDDKPKLQTQWTPSRKPPEYFDSDDPIDKVLRRLRYNQHGPYLVPE